MTLINKNDLVSGEPSEWIDIQNTDAAAIDDLCRVSEDSGVVKREQCVVVGAGGVAKAAANRLGSIFNRVIISNRTLERAQQLVESLTPTQDSESSGFEACEIDSLANTKAELYINCTPVGMTGGP
ncbi:MAG: hypothetical protein CUN54_10440, partial [Phototrophicales bacterium]